tara:strand:- start:978 stop:1868 length:891 start_codon:yes stop_codon:yes gene_type:complete
MDWTRFIKHKQTKLRADNARSSVPIYGTLRWTRASDAHNNTTNPNRNKRHRYNLNFPTIALALLTCAPTYAQTDVGGVSATANPIANSSGSVTNQAIQVLQGPYVTSSYGDGISCQGATFNFTPYATGNLSQQHPYEPIYQDPVYNNVDANDDGVPDNPGEILYYVPTRTGQKNNQTISIGMSATWSKPLDKEQVELCKTAATLHNEYRAQLTANKRLDFEIARLKNCGELMKAGIMFHPKSPYHAVCADVVLVNPPGVVGQHTHSIPKNEQRGVSFNFGDKSDASVLNEISIGNP